MVPSYVHSSARTFRRRALNDYARRNYRTYFRYFEAGAYLLLVVCAFLPPCSRAYADEPLSSKTCQHKLKEAQQLETVVQFARYSGVADFIDGVKASEIGKTLAQCRDQAKPPIADSAWKSILDAVKVAGDKAPSFQVDMRTALLLVVFSENLSPDQVSNLKEFLRSQPWKFGFSFASSIAVDALLARKSDPGRDTAYHYYTPEQMEAAVRKYVH